MKNMTIIICLILLGCGRVELKDGDYPGNRIDFEGFGDHGCLIVHGHTLLSDAIEVMKRGYCIEYEQ